jgi:hypothetical protein
MSTSIDQVLCIIPAHPTSRNVSLGLYSGTINDSALDHLLTDLDKPMRDGSLENDIIVHENTHGLTNRMTGGGTAACLQTLEAQALGEGNIWLSFQLQ